MIRSTTIQPESFHKLLITQIDEVAVDDELRLDRYAARSRTYEALAARIGTEGRLKRVR